jgi:hypothetical protein
VEAVGHAPDATKPKHDAGNSAGQAQALAADVLKQLLPRPRPDRKRRLPRRATDLAAGAPIPGAAAGAVAARLAGTARRAHRHQAPHP